MGVHEDKRGNPSSAILLKCFTTAGFSPPAAKGWYGVGMGVKGYARFLSRCKNYAVPLSKTCRKLHWSVCIQAREERRCTLRVTWNVFAKIGKKKEKIYAIRVLTAVLM